jgi:crossover junction endodeoxyribonuclease RuvC
MSRILGLDPSLTATGHARIVTRGAHDLDSTPLIMIGTITSKPKTDPTLRDRHQRLEVIADQLLDLAADFQPDVVMIEGPSLGARRQSGEFDRHGLWWKVVSRLLIRAEVTFPSFDVIEVPPANRMKYATGKGSILKDKVLAAAIYRYGQLVDLAGNDEADALILAAMGARWRGEPIEESLPQTHLSAMGGVRWPLSPVYPTL